MCATFTQHCPITQNSLSVYNEINASNAIYIHCASKKRDPGNFFHNLETNQNRKTDQCLIVHSDYLTIIFHIKEASVLVFRKTSSLSKKSSKFF